MEQAPAFTVVIPNYNGLQFMERCMAALDRQSYTSFVVINVDNGSTDGSREYLERLAADDPFCFPVRNIFFEVNTGFSGAVNAGIAAAETEYVVLLNNDTEAEPDYLKKIAEVFEADTEKRIFAVSPRMIQLYHPELLDDAGDGYNLLGWAFQRGVGQPVTTPKFGRRTSVFSACAGASAYRRAVLEEIAFDDDIESENAGGAEGLSGAAAQAHAAKLDDRRNADGEHHRASVCAAELFRPHPVKSYFDPLHFAYLEDLDVSFRARIRGYDIVYAPESEVLHVGSGTSGSKYNSFKVRLAARNNIYLNYKNMPPLMLLLSLPGILLGALVKYLFFLKRGFGRDYAAGFAEGLRTLPDCRPHRTRFRMSRLGTYIRIEGMLIRDTFSYLQDLVVRHL